MGQPLVEHAIPRDIYQYAAQQRLGTPQVACEARKASMMFSRLPGIICVLIGCLLIAVFFLLYDSIFSWWPLWQQTLLPGVGIAWIAAGLWLLLTPLLYPPARVFICPDGLIYATRKKESIPWELIMGLWKAPVINQTNNTAYTYIIRRVDGKTFAMNGELSNLTLLGERLEDEVIHRLLPRAIATYKTGAPLYFGDVAVMPQGISSRRGNKLLAWDEVENVMLKDATVSIHRKDDLRDWETMNITDVPNASVFKGAVDYILREHARNQHPHITAFNEGSPICFGGLSISRQGVELHDNQLTLPWGEIAGIGVGENEVIIHAKGKVQEWHTLPLWRLADTPRLQELVEYIMRGKP